MKKNLLILALISGVIGFVFGTGSISYAEETTSTTDTTQSEEDLVCAQNVATAASSALDDYILFLDEYFKIDKPSSEQIEDGITRYRLFVKEVNDSFNWEAVPVSNRTIARNVDSYTYCDYVTKQYLEFGKKLLTVFSLSSANSKRTYKMVDAMKAINEKMSDFSLEFSGVFPQMFQKMDNALPCYAKSCITK